MRIEIDENLPARLVDVLASQGHEADTVDQQTAARDAR
jgi:predicted nuclease of predicted toxin-antitoxin system